MKPIKRLIGYVSIKELPYNCNDCGQPYGYGDEAMGDKYSLCTCEDKKVKCDGCGEEKLNKDMDINNMFLAICKQCNGSRTSLSDEDYQLLRATGMPDDYLMTVTDDQLKKDIEFARNAADGMTKDDELIYSCLCRGANACIQCNPKMFL